jgi:hypothetical protein
MIVRKVASRKVVLLGFSERTRNRRVEVWLR